MRTLNEIQVVVLMGGLGTRLKEFTMECPKSLVDVEGKPFFDYQLDLMKKWGFRKFVFLIGYRAEMIEQYYGDGRKDDISIEYFYDGEKLLGTGGAVRRAVPYLEEDFLLIYGDSFMDINFEETVYRYFRGKAQGKRALMTVLKNNNQFDKSNVIVKDGELVLYDKHATVPEMEYIDYGACMYERALFEEYAEDVPFDVAQIQNCLSLAGEMTAHIVTKRFYEIGSPVSLEEFRTYVKHRFLEPHPAVFLDRDGVLNEIVFNEETEQLDSPMNVGQFQLLPKVAEALRIFKEKGYYVFVVTNQPAAAKGKTLLANLYDINNYFSQQMKEVGAEPDDIFMCPHYARMLPMTKEDFLIQSCSCRKPKPGLLLKAKERYYVDWERSYMIGDSYTDIEAGKKAGVKTIFLGDLKCDVCKRLRGNLPDYIVPDVYTASGIV